MYFRNVPHFEVQPFTQIENTQYQYSQEYWNWVLSICVQIKLPFRKPFTDYVKYFIAFGAQDYFRFEAGFAFVEVRCFYGLDLLMCLQSSLVLV